MTSRAPRVGAVAVATCLVFLGCGCGEQAARSDASSTTTVDTSERSSTPVGAVEQPMLRIARVGGFRPAADAFSDVPMLTVYPGGRAITQGPQIAIYPPPALPNLRVHDLTEEQLQELVSLAAEAGLLSDPPDYGSPSVADAQTTVVTLRADGSTYTHEAYALDLTQRLPASAAKARAALSAFISAATEVVVSSGEGTAYTPRAVAIRSTPHVTESSGAPAESAAPGAPIVPDAPSIEPQVQPWPLPEVDLATVDECLMVDGAAADTLLDALMDASRTTVFEQGSARFDVAVRPLLPHEDDCDELE